MQCSDPSQLQSKARITCRQCRSFGIKSGWQGSSILSRNTRAREVTRHFEGLDPLFQMTNSKGTFGPFRWSVLLTSKEALDFPGSYFVRSFFTQVEGRVYYGYSRSTTADRATQNMQLFLEGVLVEVGTRSLTGPEFSGHQQSQAEVGVSVRIAGVQTQSLSQTVRCGAHIRPRHRLQYPTSEFSGRSIAADQA